MRKGMWKETAKRLSSILLAGMILTTTVAPPVFAVHTYYWPDAISADAMEIKNWTWKAEGEAAALAPSVGLIPTGLSQQETALMGGYTSKFWFQDEKAKTITIPGTSAELDFSKFHHRYFACADSHNTGFFAPVGAQIAFQKMYYPTNNLGDYPDFLKNAPMDMKTKKFALLLVALISAAYETPSTADLRDSDRMSMYYYLLWASIWSNDKYVDQGMFTGESPEGDWDFIQYFVRTMLNSRLNPDPYGSTAIYDAFRDEGPAQKYFFNCWKAAKFLSSFDYSVDMGSVLPVSEPALDGDGMYHMTFRYGDLSDYEKEVYRRMTAENLAPGWAYSNDGSTIDFKSADGVSDGNAIATLKLQENSEEDRFYNCGFGVGGLAGFRGCAKRGKNGDFGWGNTQVYFSAVSEPLELLVGGRVPLKPSGDWEIDVHRYEHTETWEAHYNIQLRKYDSETGQPLAGSKWDILEAFDDTQLDDTSLETSDNWANRGGSQFLKWDGWDYGEGNPDGDAANNPCSWDINVTNEDGILMLGDNEENASEQRAHTDTKVYTYTKGYCGGHPEPEIEESGDPDIDAENEAAAKEAWQKEVDYCETLAEQGGFFHSLDAGEAKEQLEADRDKFYNQFISLKYEYSAVELTPRPGYTNHGSHTDDIPIEIKTVTSSEYKDGVYNKELSLHKTKDEPQGTESSDAFAPEKNNNFVEKEALDKIATPSDATSSDATSSDATPSNATPSNTAASNATASNAKKRTGLLTKLKALFEVPRTLIERNINNRSLLIDDEEVMKRVNFEPSEVETHVPGDKGITDHTFIVYDHRTEGEIHINKRDLYLQAGENKDYYAYGDSMGDGTLEGAVYGLYALKDINHPDGCTGTVYQKDDLVAVASTDRNGDASFMAFTEAPGMIWNYKSGKIEKRPEAFPGPQNLCRNRADADKVKDIENYVGFDSKGNFIHLTDSVAGDGSGYWKFSSNQSGIEGLKGSYAAYPVSDNDKNNGNCWIGRPLIVEENGTTYYVKELARSEGYELSVNGKTNSITNGRDNYEGEYQEADVAIGKITLDMVGNGNYFDVTAYQADHDITLHGIKFPEGAVFELSTSEKVPEKITVPVYRTVLKPVMAAAGTFVYQSGQKVAAVRGDVVTFPEGQSYRVNAVSAREEKTIGVKPMNYHTMGTPAVTELFSGGSPKDFQALYNMELDNLGYKEPEADAPWVRVKLSGTTDTEWILSITEAMKAHSLQYFNSLRISDMEQTGGELYAIMRYEWKIYDDSRDDAVYNPEKDCLYVKKDSGNGYFVYVPYDEPASNPAVLSYRMKNGFLERATLKEQNIDGLNVSYPSKLPESFAMVTARTPSYWIYAPGEQQIDDAGNFKYSEETIVDYVEQEGFKTVEKKIRLTSTYDTAKEIYVVTLPSDAFKETDTVRLKVSDDGSGKYSIKQAYIDQSFFACQPLQREADSYIQNVTLTPPTIDQPWQDGNTRTEPADVMERPIMQKIKVVKDILVEEGARYEDNTFADSGHEDYFTQNGGGTKDNVSFRPNFRFKIYLRSNLEQLYRTEDGEIEWLDRNGNTVDAAAYRAAYPARVQKIYTKVLHRTDLHSRRSNRDAIANQELYGFTDGLINENQETGYTAILETTLSHETDANGNEKETRRLNYEKFFDAVRVANQDKWDKAKQERTSFKPFAFIRRLLFGTAGSECIYPAEHNNTEIQNKANTSVIAKENSDRSDSVRQFAIQWYLDREVEKLVRENFTGETEIAAGHEGYQDEVYDTALKAAVIKAENYLKPFFHYDLDEIYAIEWDSESDGGRDKDKTTLSADKEEAAFGYCYGISEYLPYGTYVTVEQQPMDKELGDFLNKHYAIDAPKEIELPAVYEDEKTGDGITPERLSRYYNYNTNLSAADLTAKYFIRFNEEWPGEIDENVKDYVIKAHGYLGDYEIYKYGLDLNKIAGTALGDPYKTPHFEITQSEYDPLKDYYHTIVFPEEDGGNPNSHYLADDVNHGVTAPNGTEYERDGIERIYRYGSVSENKQTYDAVSYSGEYEAQYQDHVSAMEGMQTAYDGKYASMLVPWTITEPVSEEHDTIQNPDGSASGVGYGYRKFRNTFYRSRLRIEKLDSETGENILHDGAVFTVYAAEREDGEKTDGRVKFYKTDTLIKGSREFLEAMGAKEITKAARALPGIGGLWTGIVEAGTPVCRESEQIIMTNANGRRTGGFEAYTTTRDGLQAEEENPSEKSWQDQNTGYLITPQPLGAGTYVLCEMRPPSGYVRTKPVAIEIYSDKISYYLNGNQDGRVVAAVYEDGTVLRPEGAKDTARVYVGNTPIRLEISKLKDRDRTVTYRTQTRVDGSETELKAKYGQENLEFAYKEGSYLNYAWYKGTAEYLESRKLAGDAVEPVCIDGIFAGYGLITRPLDTADDTNRYVSGAKMALYDAVEVKSNGDSGDYGYDGVEVLRDRNNNVQSIKLLEGYAGNTVEFVNLVDIEGSLSGSTGHGTWTYRTVERKDTDILYYSLGGLRVTELGRDGNVYGYDRDGNRIQVRNQKSVYAIKNGHPVFELTGGDLEHAVYSSLDKCFKLQEGTKLYHVDSDGNRDAKIDPATGMAYTTEVGTDQRGKKYERILVWPVNVSKTVNGAVIAQEKIKTYRIASIHADTEAEYTIGTYDGTMLKKSVNPVVGSHGLPDYYQRSDQVYKKGEPVYDIDHDYVRYRYYDLLPAFNRNAYRINNQWDLRNVGEKEDPADDKKLFHRQGEAWIMENTWMSGDEYPNDPFNVDLTTGRADMLKRVIPGTYIMEEVEPPAGYVKGFPVGITVKETKQVQNAELEDEKIKIEIVKTDAADQYRIDVISDYQGILKTTEPKGAYSYGQISGAHLALYKARRKYTTDTVTYPSGYYLEKTENTPAKWTVENSEDNSPVIVTADWITDGKPKYFEGIPAGDYILEEIEASSGYVRHSMELEVKKTGEVQTFHMKDDHTKLEVFKYCMDGNGNMIPLPMEYSAGLALYRAETDEDGNIKMNGGEPQYVKDQLIDEWMTDDLKAYTEDYEISPKWLDRMKAFFGLAVNQSSFILDFENTYRKLGDNFVWLTWHTKAGKKSAERISSIKMDVTDSAVQLWRTDDGKMIRITIYRNVHNGSLDEDGQLPLNFEYQFNYRELAAGLKSYDTLEGVHRIDYLPFTDIKDGRKVGNYVLIEAEVPEGFERTKPKAVVLEENGSVQRFSLENVEKYVSILKVISDGTNEYAVEGVKMALYRPGTDGSFIHDERNLIERWISGADGRFTEEEWFLGNIPEGFRVGDIRPHQISKIPDGTYYIVEEEVPPYMAKREPVKIEIGGDTATIIRVVNQPAQGRLELLKKAADTGELLENARFLITNRDTKEEWYITTGHNGRAELKNLAVGEVRADGTINPYTYTIEEVSPPDYYQISGGKKFFTFDGTADSQVVTYTHAVENYPTQIHFKKTNFDTGMALEGAKIAVYHAVAIDGEYVKNGEAIEINRSGPEGFTIKKKLSAGHVYIMEEMEAPTGIHLSPPVIFTVNQAGTGISNIRNNFSVLECSSAGGTIESLTVFGRAADKTFTVLKDLDTGEVLPDIISSTDILLTADDGIEEGHLYEITEYTRYSDGNTEMSKKETRRIWFDENGTFLLPSRTYLGTRLQLENQARDELDTWTVENGSFKHVIENPVTKERAVAEVTGTVGNGQMPVTNGDVIKYVITYENSGLEKADLIVSTKLEKGLEFMRSSGNPVKTEGILTWQIHDAEPHSVGHLELAALVSGQMGASARAVFTVSSPTNLTETILENPIAPKGSLTVRNHISGTGRNPQDTFTYQMRFLDSSGKLLSGYQNYTGTKEGRIKGMGQITLKGDEYVIFPGLPYGTEYAIIQEVNRDYETVTRELAGAISKEARGAVFENNRNDETVREVLTAGGNYRLTETTGYTDGMEQTTGIYRFTLNESGKIDNVDMEDRPVKLYFSKIDIAAGDEISGGIYAVVDAETENEIYRFTKVESVPVLIPADVLIPGKEYILREGTPPDGYSREEDIRFTVNEAGIPETIIMQDRKTRIYLEKLDADTGESVTGGYYCVRDIESGETVFCYTASGKPVLAEGILAAGRTYELAEEKPPAGYGYCESIVFTVPLEPETITVRMKDKKTEIIVKKLTLPSPANASPSDAERQKPGFILQILNKDKSPAKAVRDFSGFKAGEELVFTTELEFKTISGQLAAGGEYWLHEVKPRDGYAFAEDVPFTVGRDGSHDIVIMVDKPTHVVLSKKELTGSRELPGNHMAVLDEDGKVLERWISGERPHDITAKLIAGKTYYLCEETPEAGYAYAEKVPFTVSEDGSTDLVEMKNDMTRVRINKKDESGNTVKGAVLQVLTFEKDKIIFEFETTGEPVEVTGKLTAGETYYLHEKQSPPGYLPAADISFTVPRKNQQIEVTMIDLKRHDSEINTMYLMKTDAETGKGLEGFEFTVTGPGGNTYTVITNKEGKAEFSMPSDGIYTFRETKRKAGYLISEETYTFTILNGRVTGDSMILVADQPLPPEEPDDTRRVGRITASYKSGFRGMICAAEETSHPTGERTGDEYPLGAVLAAMLLCLAGLVYRLRRTDSRKHDREGSR